MMMKLTYAYPVDLRWKTVFGFAQYQMLTAGL
jgi:hypothetical protein